MMRAAEVDICNRIHAAIYVPTHNCNSYPSDASSEQADGQGVEQPPDDVATQQHRHVGATLHMHGWRQKSNTRVALRSNSRFKMPSIPATTCSRHLLARRLAPRRTHPLAAHARIRRLHTPLSHCPARA